MRSFGLFFLWSLEFLPFLLSPLSTHSSLLLNVPPLSTRLFQFFCWISHLEAQAWNCLTGSLPVSTSTFIKQEVGLIRRPCLTSSLAILPWLPGPFYSAFSLCATGFVAGASINSESPN